MKRLGVLFGLVLVSLCLLGVSSAAVVPLAGSLDPSFGSGGLVTHSLGSNEYPSVGGIAVQPDGKIVVAGGSTPGDPGFLLARYLPDGSPDPSFGAGGYVETSPYPPASYAFIRAIALQPDGKIVVAGVSDGLESENVLNQFTLARYNPDGSLDTSFGTGGITNTAIPEPVPQAVPRISSANALAVLPNGKILVGGSAGWSAFPDQSSFALVRYTPGGALDPTFGSGGIVQTAFSGFDYLAGIAVRQDGKIVASGSSSGPGHGDYWESMALARYEPDGALDPSFGTAGKVTSAHKLGYGGGPPTLQRGKILVVGSVLARYGASGRVDTSFGKHGFAKIRGVTGERAADVVQKDGKILIAAYTGANLQQGDGVVVRLLPNGRPDPSFGSGGIVSLPDQVSTLALQTDRKILVGGGYGNAWTLSRLIGGNNCVVPSLRGKTISQGTTALKKSYCRRGHIAKRFSSKVTRGRVISTAPPHNARLPGGTKVDLIVSKGKRT